MTATMARTDGVMLEVRGLTASYGDNVVVRDVYLEVSAGEILGLAGESGCGKSTLALSAMGYRHGRLEIQDGVSLLGGVDLLSLDAKGRRARWGAEIAYVPQGAAASLNPAHSIATHFRLLFKQHRRLSHRASDIEARGWLHRVGLPDDALRRFPHQFSGGQAQRISLALALACNPKVVILDEPTTGLDVTTQAQITTMLRRLVDELQIGAIYVSHDLALLGTLADRLAVMYAGEIVEVGPAEHVLFDGMHPYSRALRAAAPSIDERRPPVGILGSPPVGAIDGSCAFAPRCPRAQDDCVHIHPELRTIDAVSFRCHHPVLIDESERLIDGLDTTQLVVVTTDVVGATDPTDVIETTEVDIRTPVLEVVDLTCTYRTSHGSQVAVDGAGLQIAAGETLALVGESGSGKSTLLRALAGIHPTASGTIRLDGVDIALRAGARDRSSRAAIQLVFQNSDLALNPRHTVGDAIARSLHLFRSDIGSTDRRAEVAALLELVKLPASVIDRLPGDLSGGQRQRVAFARAFASRPRVLLCDEVTSALDVSVQATILTLIAELAERFDTAVLFVSHDLAVVRSISHRTSVMQHGHLRETASTDELFASPNHEYTRELLAAVPSPGVRRSQSLTGPG